MLREADAAPLEPYHATGPTLRFSLPVVYHSLANQTLDRRSRNQWEKYHGFNPAVITGKPVEEYGAKGREEATGRGVGALTVKLSKRLGHQAEESTVAFEHVWQTAQQHDVSLREAAYIIGITRVRRAAELAGFAS